MSVCVSCGDVELFWVPSCGDPAVGDSSVLLFDGPEVRLLDAEAREIARDFQAIEEARGTENPDEVIDAQDAVTAKLDDYIRPMDNLPEKHLVQAYRMRARKWTFIRSDKMRNHLRSYGVDKSLLRATAGPDGQNRLDRAQLARAFGAVGERVRSDLAQGIASPRGQLIKGEVAAGLLEGWADEWAEWVDAVNASLAYSHRGANHDLSAGAQLLRAYAGFGLDLGYNRREGTYGLSLHGEARAVLAEAKAKLEGYLPHAEGWHAFVEYGADGSQAGRQGQADFGYFRFRASVSVHAMLGAAVMGTAGIEYAPRPDGKVLALPAPAGAKGTASFEAFAGLEAGGEVKGALEWDNPEGRASSGQPGWAALVEVGAGVAVNLGVGGQLDIYVTYENGKFMFRAKGQAVIGIGAKGEMTGMVGFDTIVDFVMYVYHMLKDNGFGLLHFIHETAFHAVTAAVLFALKEGTDALMALARVSSDFVRDARARLANDYYGAQQAEDYARRIKSRPDMLYFATPEAKGAILDHLCHRFFFSFEEHQEGAILVVMETIQTKREWDQVAERINPMGAKSTKAAGMAKLNAVLDGGSQRKFDAAVAALESLPVLLDPGLPVDRTRRFA